MSELATELENDDVPPVEEPSEAESKALEQGWAPQEEWRGREEDWIDAEEFLKRGEENIGIMRERNDKLVNEVVQTKSEVAQVRKELANSVKLFGEATRKAEERAYKQGMQDLHAKQEAAVEVGDTDEWRKLESDKARLAGDYQQQTQPEPEVYDPSSDPAFSAWHAENDWYDQDVEMTIYAQTASRIIEKRYPAGVQLPKSFYDEVSLEVKKKFPDKFRNTRRDRPSGVQGPTTTGSGNKGAKGYKDLPAEAKAACDRFVSQKLMTQEDYAKQYFGE